MITQQDIDDFAADADDDHCPTCNDTCKGQAPDSACSECSNPRSRKYQSEP